MEKEKILLIIYSLYLLISSLITLILYKRDKKIAVTNNGMRIKEKTLLEMVVFGGVIGGLIGTYAFHHKSDKIYFTITTFLSLFLQLIILCFMIFLCVRGEIL